MGDVQRLASGGGGESLNVKLYKIYRRKIRVLYNFIGMRNSLTNSEKFWSINIERDHPITKDIQRIASVLSKQCSHRIKKWWREGNLIKGTIETLDDGLYGTALTKNIIQGENPSFSLRALASLEKKGNISFVNRPPKVITYDEVNLPSHKEAYAEPRKTKVISDGNTEYTYENVKVTNGEIAIEAADIKDILVSKSDNLKIVCESFNIDPATVKLISGGRQLSAKSGSDTLVWTLESNLCRETADMWRYFSR